jgi:hypothetical protein
MVLESQIPDQNLRRSFQAKLLKHGKLTPAAFQVFREGLQETSGRVSAEIPQALPLLGNDGLYDFLAGKTSEEVFRTKFMEALANPIARASMSSIPELNSILDLSRFFWSHMEELTEILSRFVSAVKTERHILNPLNSELHWFVSSLVRRFYQGH